MEFGEYLFQVENHLGYQLGPEEEDFAYTYYLRGIDTLECAYVITECDFLVRSIDL